MAYKIKVTGKNRTDGLFSFVNEIWDIMIDLDNGIFMETETQLVLKNKSEMLFTIMKNEAKGYKDLSRTKNIDKNHFKVLPGMMPKGTPCLFYKQLENNSNEYIISSVYGGLSGDFVKIKVDLDSYVEDFELPTYKPKLRTEKYEYSLNFTLGDSIDEVISKYPNSEKNEYGVWRLYDIGVNLRCSEQECSIDEISLGEFIGSNDPVDFIFGIKVGDNVDLCKELWGEPIKEYFGMPSDYNLTFHYKDYLLNVWFWKKDSTGNDPIFTSYKKDTVRSIELRMKD